MTRERYFLGDEREAWFDWQRSARELDIPLDLARDLYLRATQRTVDAQRAEQLYRGWLGDAAATRAPETPAPVPGRLTQVMRQAGGRSWQPDELARLTTGKWTGVQLAYPRNNEDLPGREEVRQLMASLTGAVSDASAQSTTPAKLPVEPTAASKDPHQAAASKAPHPAESSTAPDPAALSDRPPRSGQLPAAVLARMEHAYGQRFDDVEIHRDSAEVPAGQQAVTHGRHVHFEPGAFDPDSEHGEQILAHEFAHVAQQSQPTSDAQPASRAALEADAHQAALAVIAGRAARVNVSASPRMVLGFSNGKLPPRRASAPAAGTRPPVQGTRSSARSPGPTAARAGAAPATKSGAAASRTAAPAHPAGASTVPVPTASARKGAGGDGLLIPEAPTALTPSAAGRLHTTQVGNQGVAAATTQLPTATQQTDVARAAVVEPQAEQDAHAEHGVVTAVDNRPPPSPEIEQACVRIRQVIRDKRPTDEDKLVEAKPKEMAQAAGEQMSAGVEQRAGEVRQGYDEIQHSPTGTPTTTPVPATLPPTKAQTPQVDAAAGTPDPLGHDDVSLDGDVAAQKKKIDDAGMNTEPGKLVQDGPIGDAREGASDFASMAKTDPQKVLADQAATIAKAKGDMQALQAAGEKALADARAGTVSHIGTHTTGVKGSEEQQRAQAGEKMKDVFSRTQQSVDKLLQPLAGNAVARWDAGVAQLSTEFEASLADVKRRIDERHSGVGGALVGAWDWATGLPDWVTEGYDRAEAKFGDGATSLIRDISRDVNAVIDDCKQLIQQARKDIDAVVKSLPASLQAWAQGEAAKLGQQLDALDKRVDQTQKGINKDLINHANSAVQQVRERVAQLREEAKGALAKIADAIGEFLKNPFKAIVDGLLRILGIPPASFWSLVGKLGDVVSAIAKDPVKFGKTLISGAGKGFQQFFEHFPTHLKEIVMGWLFGQLGAAGVPMPTDFSGPGILATVLSVVGIDGGLVNSMLGGALGDPDEMAEAHQEIAGVLSGDPKALVALFHDHFDAASLIPMLREAAINFLIQALITRVAARIAALLVPGGAILQAVEAIFKVLTWVITNAARIFTLIESLVGAAAQAVAGNTAGVANAVESSLVQAIVLVIDFLAGYLGLGGLGAKLKGVVMKLAGKLKGALKKVIDAITKRAKAKAKAKRDAKAPAHDKPKHDDKAAAAQHPKHDERDPQKAKDDAKDPRNHMRDPDDKDPRNHHKDDDKDPRDHKSDKDKDKDDHTRARHIARTAVDRAWAEARAATTPKLLNEPQLDSLLNSAGGKEGKGATVAIKLNKLGKVWSLESQVRLGTASAEAIAGHGWIATAPGGRPWFATNDLSALNRKIIKDAKDELVRYGQEQSAAESFKTASERARAIQTRSQSIKRNGQTELDGHIRGLTFSIELAPHGSGTHGKELLIKFEISPNTNDNEAIVPIGSDSEEVERLDNSRLTIEERIALIEEAQRITGDVPLVARIIKEVRNHGTPNNTAVLLLKRLCKESLTSGHRLKQQTRKSMLSARTLYMDYFGVYQASSGTIAIDTVKRTGTKSGEEIGWAYVKPVAADEHGENPIESLAMDFLVPPAIESAGIRGVGSEMARRASEAFKTQYQAVVGEWYKLSGYASGGRSDLSANLTKYIKGRKQGLSPADSVRGTFTYNRVREIYGGGELKVTVREFQNDWDNLQEGQVIEALMRPE